ncbi:SoxR reducing system RseC family protein [Alteromonas oceanisediminis]|uniref:SoxR reducing system RseC family protein n=1 Tax=Alteromonas oceanisediminis TaxID=2836180 RepID=UPI001BDB0DA0|nr:SoxR reducing system RseC family protein [Alteromonas oceanisediminis]MBT0585798.1 SoxR reducing system RseC family protein [Alteromonas oceanisediminis]
MIEEVGVVTAVNGNSVTVETAIKSTCGSCQAQSNCGTGAIARALTPRAETIHLISDLPVHVGQRVRLGIPEEALLSASVLLYLVPLMVLVISSVTFNALLPWVGLSHEFWTILFTLIATLAGFVVLSNRLKRRETAHYQPKILGILLEPPQGITPAS